MYKQKIVDAITGEETWRDYTKEEIAIAEQWEKEHALIVEQNKEIEKARKSALAKLAALGLTEEEIAAL